MITIANTITIVIAIAIFPISPRPNAHTYAHNRWEAGSRFCWKIWVRDLLSPRSTCLPFLRNLRLQSSTPWGWGILRSCRGVHAKDKVQTMISTDVMISATIRHLPPASQCLAFANQGVSGSSMQERTWERIVKWDCEGLPSSECTCNRLGGVLGCVLGGVLRSVLRAYLGVYSQAGWECANECNWECTWEHAWECDWERLESLLESL
jgi:hypothetical protein